MPLERKCLLRRLSLAIEMQNSLDKRGCYDSAQKSIAKNVIGDHKQACTILRKWALPFVEELPFSHGSMTEKRRRTWQLNHESFCALVLYTSQQQHNSTPTPKHIRNIWENSLLCYILHVKN